MKDNERAYENFWTVRRYARARAVGLRADETAIFDRFAHELSGARLLDIGVGAGRTTGPLLERVREYVGIDIAVGMVRECNRVFPRTPIFVQDARDLSRFRAGEFDAVCFSFNGIDYVEHDDRLRILSEVRRVLRPDGLFVFSTHNRDWELWESTDPFDALLKGGLGEPSAAQRAAFVTQVRRLVARANAVVPVSVVWVASGVSTSPAVDRRFAEAWLGLMPLVDGELGKFAARALERWLPAVPEAKQAEARRFVRLAGAPPRPALTGGPRLSAPPADLPPALEPSGRRAAFSATMAALSHSLKRAAPDVVRAVWSVFSRRPGSKGAALEGLELFGPGGRSLGSPAAARKATEALFASRSSAGEALVELTVVFTREGNAWRGGQHALTVAERDAALEAASRAEASLARALARALPARASQATLSIDRDVWGTSPLAHGLALTIDETLQPVGVPLRSAFDGWVEAVARAGRTVTGCELTAWRRSTTLAGLVRLV